MAGEREVIIVDPNAQALKQFRDEMRAYEKNPIDRSAKPGGYFLNADGSGAHDANGAPVPLLPRDKEHADDLAQVAKARYSTEAEEAVPLDSPEEVAARATVPARAGQPWTPPAIEPGTVMGQDGSVSQPDASKKPKKK